MNTKPEKAISSRTGIPSRNKKETTSDEKTVHKTRIGQVTGISIYIHKAGCNPEGRRRKSVAMYDPARDIYTSADAAPLSDASVKGADTQPAPPVTQSTQSSVPKEQQPQTLVDGPGPLNPAVSATPFQPPQPVRSVFVH